MTFEDYMLIGMGLLFGAAVGAIVLLVAKLIVVFLAMLLCVSYCA